MAITDQDFDYVSQNAHLCLGALIVMTPAALGASNKVLAIVVLAFLALMAVKEFWYDYKYETAEIRGSSLRDYCFYSLGVCIGLSIYFGGSYFLHSGF
jgi:hypothetical protein